MGHLFQAVVFSFSPLVPEDLTQGSRYSQHPVKLLTIHLELFPLLHWTLAQKHWPISADDSLGLGIQLQSASLIRPLSFLRKVTCPQRQNFSGTVWLILCVNLARLWCPAVWSNTSIDVAVKVFFQIWLLFTISSLQIKQITLHNVGGTHPISWRP